MLLCYLMLDCANSCFALTFHDVRDAGHKQKCGKAVGLDDVAMETIMHGGDRLLVHICSLFNIFLNFSFVPEEFMRCVIIPLVKNKSDDLSAVNNYRAISISIIVNVRVFNSVHPVTATFTLHLAL